MFGVRSLFRDVGRHVPAAIIEDRDQHSGGERFKVDGKNQSHEKEVAGAVRAFQIARPQTRITAPNSSKVSTTCILAVAVMPQVTTASMPRNQMAPMPLAQSGSWR